MNEKITQIVAVDIIPNAISLDRTADIVLTGEPSLNPMAVYLSQLSPSSRRTMRGALETIAKIVSAGGGVRRNWLPLGRTQVSAYSSYLQAIDRALRL